MTEREDAWLWGWDPTPGIVSVWAEGNGWATVWRRVDGQLRVERERFRPWLLVDRLDDVRGRPGIRVRELDGDGALRFLVEADDWRRIAHLRDRGPDAVHALPPDEQYLVQSGRTYFRGMGLDDLRRVQIDLETTGLDATRDRVRLAAVRAPDGTAHTIEGDEADVIARLVAWVRELDPDVIENDDLHGFDLPFLVHRARVTGVPLRLARTDEVGLRERGARSGKTRYIAPGRELIDTLDPLIGGPAFALAQMVPRRYERLGDAGSATGILDPLLVRAYVHAGAALPAHQRGGGESHAGASLHLFASGVAHRIVKADVASLYPSLMRTYRIGPARDRLGAMLALVDRLVDQRLAAKAKGRAAPAGSAERHRHEAMSTAIKLVINSAYGYLAAGSLTRFSDVDAANEVTRRGREVLALMCRELAARGVTLVEADTDGVYFAVPPAWTEADETRVVDEVAALLPAGVQLELDGRYAAMLSHEPKNYALRGYDGALTLRGVAFRSSRAEPFGAAFLRAAIGCLLADDVPGVRAAFLASIAALRRRALDVAEVSSLVRLTRTPEEYLAQRDQRRELAYEAVLAAGRTQWDAGARVRVYRTTGGGAALVRDGATAHDYDVDHYVRLLRTQFAARLARAFTPDDFAEVFADPDQLSLFPAPLDAIRTILSSEP